MGAKHSKSGNSGGKKGFQHHHHHHGPPHMHGHGPQGPRQQLGNYNPYIVSDNFPQSNGMNSQPGVYFSPVQSQIQANSQPKQPQLHLKKGVSSNNGMIQSSYNPGRSNPFTRPQGFDALQQNNQNSAAIRSNGISNLSNNASSEDKPVPKPKFCLENQSNTTKNQMHRSIKNKDLALAQNLVELYNIEPNEECSVKGFYWTGLHYAAHFDSNKHLEYFAKLIYKNRPKDYVEIMNVVTKEGYTPLMIAAIYGRVDSIEILAKCGGIRLNTKTEKGQTAKDLALHHEKIECYSLLDYLEGKNNTGIIPINISFLEGHVEVVKKAVDLKALENIEDSDQWRDLITRGERIPCMICQENTGWIKYTVCCGQPLHSLCLGDHYNVRSAEKKGSC